MRDQIDRYFELLPVLAIALGAAFMEVRANHLAAPAMPQLERMRFEAPAYPRVMDAPRLIFR
jgi:hypothetical protein